MMRHRSKFVGIGTLVLSLALVGCTSSTSEPAPTPEPEITQGFDNPLTVEESEDLLSGDTWIISLPDDSEDSLTRTLGNVTFSLPSYLEDSSEEIAAPAHIRVYAKILEDDLATTPDAPVENLYVYQIPLEERLLDLSDEERAELAEPLEQLAFVVARDKKNAFTEAEDFTSGLVTTEDGVAVGQYVSLLSVGERLTTIEILDDEDVYIFSSTITGEVAAPEYIKNIELP